MTRLPLLLSTLAIAACSTAPPFATTIGVLKPGATLTVRVASATVNAYQPATNQRRDLFTIAATALPRTSPPPAPRVSITKSGPLVTAPGALSSLLVRVPDGVTLSVDSEQGDVNVTDITGNVTVRTAKGNVAVMISGYAQAAVNQGNVAVTMGSTRWPGTLRFSTNRGDVELRVNPNAAFAVHMHTDDGTLFTDFGLRGASAGASETIDGSVNGGSARRIDVRTSAGSIRLLRLQPQA